jgi:hypothetical protein
MTRNKSEKERIRNSENQKDQNITILSLYVHVGSPWLVVLRVVGLLLQPTPPTGQCCRSPSEDSGAEPPNIHILQNTAVVVSELTKKIKK